MYIFSRDLVREWNVIGVQAFYSAILGRIEAGKGLKFFNEMGLIIIIARHGKIGPIDIFALSD